MNSGGAGFSCANVATLKSTAQAGSSGRMQRIAQPACGPTRSQGKAEGRNKIQLFRKLLVYITLYVCPPLYQISLAVHCVTYAFR